MSDILLTVQATPSTPSTGQVLLYFKSDKLPYFKDDAGTEVAFATLSSGVVLPSKGGTGVANNNASTLTISGAFGATFTLANTTALTLPITGTLATLAGSETLTNKSLTSPTITGTLTAAAANFSGAVATGALTTSGTVILGGANQTTTIGTNGTGTEASILYVVGGTGNSGGGGISFDKNSIQKAYVGMPSRNFGGTSSDLLLYSAADTIISRIGATSVTTVSSTGLAVTGAGSFSGTLTASAQILASFAGASIAARDTTAYSAGATGGALLVQGLDSTSTNNNLGVIQGLAKAARYSDIVFKFADAGSTTEGMRIVGGATPGVTLPGTLAVTGAGSFSGAVATGALTVSGLITGNRSAELSNIDGTAVLKLDTTNASSKGSAVSFSQNGVLRGYIGVSGFINGTTDGNIAVFAEAGKTINFWPNGTASGGVQVSSTGLAVTGTGSFSGLVTSTKTTGSLLTATSATTAALWIEIGNSASVVYAGVEYGNTIIAAGSTNGDMVFRSSTGISFSANSGAGTQMRLAASGAVAVPYVWANTGGTTAVMVDSNGTLFKLASARKYKTDFAPYTKGLADVLKLDPQYYRLRHNPAMVDAQVVIDGVEYGYKKMAVQDGARDDQVLTGFVADDLHNQKLSEFVAYGPDGPDSINYGNMVALLTNAIKEIDARLTAAKL